MSHFYVARKCGFGVNQTLQPSTGFTLCKQSCTPRHAGQHVVYAGDPLKDLALTAFLDKFIAKKPKVSELLGSLCGGRA